MKIGDKIKFRLDNHWVGEGIIKASYSNVYEVELTAPCKEFDTGVMIIILKKEVVE